MFLALFRSTWRIFTHVLVQLCNILLILGLLWLWKERVCKLANFLSTFISLILLSVPRESNPCHFRPGEPRNTIQTPASLNSLPLISVCQGTPRTLIWVILSKKCPMMKSCVIILPLFIHPCRECVNHATNESVHTISVAGMFLVLSFLKELCRQTTSTN